MELNVVELLLEKYFQGKTNILEENELRDYFYSSNVAPHLESYKNIFGYSALSKEQNIEQKTLTKRKKRILARIAIAALAITLLGIGAYGYFNFYDRNQTNNLGTCNNPEVAFIEAQKALMMISKQLNSGMKSAQYVQEYEKSKKLIFKPQLKQ